jgi:signal transduction histidine kinase
MNDDVACSAGGSGPTPRQWLPHWSIAARSAFICGAMVLVALAATGMVLTAVFYRSMIAGVDAAAAARVRDLAADLNEDSPADIDDPLLATDQRIAAVQVIAQDGTVLRRSESAPTMPLVPIDTVSASLRVGMRPDSVADSDLRVSAQSVTTAKGSFIVVVACGVEAAVSTVRAAALVLLTTAPIVVAVAAAAAYRLVRRSLRSVDAIRSRVGAISTSDLAERVPVPPGRDEISALAVTMNDMLGRIEAGHAAQRRFVGDASHELRSPLTAIISALDVATAHPQLVGAELTRDILVPEALRMRTLVEDLLLLARADERGLTFHRDQIRLDELTASEVTRLRRSCPLTVTVTAWPVELRADGPALSRVLRNLLDNAARHAASRIDVSVVSQGDQAVLTVADDGPGIPAADRRRVFARFVRLDAARSRASGGSGLGLSIATEIVTAHGGAISIGDQPGGGTVMTVQLPLANTPDSRR